MGKTPTSVIRLPGSQPSCCVGNLTVVHSLCLALSSHPGNGNSDSTYLIGFLQDYLKYRIESP